MSAIAVIRCTEQTVDEGEKWSRDQKSHHIATYAHDLRHNHCMHLNEDLPVVLYYSIHKLIHYSCHGIYIVDHVTTLLDIKWVNLTSMGIFKLQKFLVKMAI